MTKRIKYLDKVKAIDSQNDETWVLAALNHQCTYNLLTAKTGGCSMEELYNQYLAKAEKINPENPRIYYLKGSSLFYTPEMYGGGKAQAKTQFEKAKELFAKET